VEEYEEILGRKMTPKEKKAQEQRDAKLADKLDRKYLKGDPTKGVKSPEADAAFWDLPGSGEPVIDELTADALTESDGDGDLIVDLDDL
jgi:hypothetical protein